MTTTTTDLNSLPYPFADSIDLNGDQQHHILQLPFSPNPQASSSSSSSPSCPFLFHPYQHQAGATPFQFQHQADELVAPHRSWELSTAKHESNNSTVLKFSLSMSKNEAHHEGQEHQIHDPSDSVKWMSSKMTMMRKMNCDPTNSSVEKIAQSATEHGDHQKHPCMSYQSDNSNNSSSNNNDIIRVCADCNTTKTPLWRSGPRGPKSLCNACGIRQRKARRAMAAAAAAAEGGTVSPASAAATVPSVKCKAQTKNKKLLPYKKRSKMDCAAPESENKKLRFEDFALSLSEKSAFYHQVFPQDEKEAAILLMALSCGLVHG